MSTRLTRKKTATIQAMATDLNKDLGLESSALAKVIEETMARYFKDADEKSEARQNRLEKRLDCMQSVLTRHTEEIKTLRADTERLQERVAQAEKVADDHRKQLQEVTSKLIGTEDRARRNNLLILNLKEGLENPNALAYLNEMVRKWFPALASSPPEFMRAHRLGQPRSTPAGHGQRPRPLILNCLRFTERDALLKEARRNPPEVAGITLKFAADYSEHTSQRRKACYKTMHAARLQGFEAFLMYPATIKLQRGSDTRLFEDPSDAEKFLDSLKD